MMIGDIRVHPDIVKLGEAVARRWIDIADEAIAARGKFNVALSGGSTPQHLYRQLANPKFAARISWDRVFVYFGDERTVGPDDPESNYHMACESLLDHVAIPQSNIFRIEAEAGDLGDAATKYARTLTSMLPMSAQGIVEFDLLLLGVGSDGHIASLFPATSILHERARLVEAVYVEKLQTWRISVTLPVIDHARHIMILVSGDNKAEIIQQVFAGQRSPPYPVQLINPRGMLEWHLDEAAARLLPAELRS